MKELYQYCRMQLRDSPVESARKNQMPAWLHSYDIIISIIYWVKIIGSSPYIIKDDFISLTTKQKERLGLISIDQEQLFTYEVEEWEAS